MSVVIENLILTIVTRDKPLSLLEIEIASGAGRWSVNVAIDNLYKDGEIDYELKKGLSGHQTRMWFKVDKARSADRARSIRYRDCVMSRLWNSDVFAAT